MSKTYNYKGLSFPVADDTNVYLEVEYVSNGNTSFTVVNKPGPIDPEIDNEGKVLIDIGRNLRSETTYVNTQVDNLVPQADTIKIRFKLNGTVITEHTNPKSETASPFIVLHINFPNL
jgi:hypothetical protein